VIKLSIVKLYMIFLHINSKSSNASLFNKYVEEGKQIFVLFYMEGCGPCNITKPEWKEIETMMKTESNDNVVIVDVDHEVLQEIQYLESNPVGFPTMRYITNKGKTSEDYSGERKTSAFVSWIKSKIKRQDSKDVKPIQKSKSSKNYFKTSNYSKKTKKKHYIVSPFPSLKEIKAAQKNVKMRIKSKKYKNK
jgi:hypothetical protein